MMQFAEFGFCMIDYINEAKMEMRISAPFDAHQNFPRCASLFKGFRNPLNS